MPERKKKDDSIRVRLIVRGTTIARWARARGYRPSTVYSALARQRGGVKATRILREIEEYTR